MRTQRIVAVPEPGCSCPQAVAHLTVDLGRPELTGHRRACRLDYEAQMDLIFRVSPLAQQLADDAWQAWRQVFEAKQRHKPF